MNRPKYIIKDWAGNKPFGDMIFTDFEDACSYLYGKIEQRYGIPQNEEQERMFELECGEYSVEEVSYE